MNTMPSFKVTKFILLFTILLIGSQSGCIRKKFIKKTPTSIFNAAMDKYLTKNYSSAIVLLKKALRYSPTEPTKEETIFYLGKSNALVDNYPEAVSYLTRYIKEYPSGAYLSEAICILSGLNPSLAKPYLNKVNLQLVPQEKWKGYCLINKALENWEKGNRIGALYELENSLQLLNNSSKIKALIKSGFYSLSVTEKNEVGYYGTFLRDLYILYKAENGHNKQLDKFRKINDPNLLNQFTMLKKQFALFRKESNLTPYVLLPLNGAYAPIGTKLLEDIFYALQSSTQVIIGNTWGDRIFTRLFLKKIGQKINPISLGPVLSWDLQEAMNINKSLKIPILTINSSLPLKNNGGFTFRINLTPEEIVKKLVDFAMSRGLKKFAIFRPKSEYGETYANLFSREVLSRGGKIIWEIDYPENTRDFRYYFWKVLGIKNKDDEKKFFDQLKEKQLEVPVEAVFIPDNWNTVSFLIPQFGYFGMNELTFLCTRDAINPRNTDILGDYDVYAAASFYPFSDTPAVEKFEEEFEDKVGRVPSYWDAYQVIAASILQKCLDRKNRFDLRKCITRQSGFNTFLGNIRIKENGEAVIPIRIFTIRDDEWIEMME